MTDSTAPSDNSAEAFGATLATLATAEVQEEGRTPAELNEIGRRAGEAIRDAARDRRELGLSEEADTWLQTAVRSFVEGDYVFAKHGRLGVALRLRGIKAPGENREAIMKIGTVLAPISFVLASLVFIPAAANAQTGGPTSAFPAKGEARYVGYFTGRTISEMKFGDDSYTLEEEVGVTRNLDGHPLFDQMSVRCLGGLQIIGGTLKAVGMCTKTDRDGDVVVSTYEGIPPRGGTHTIVSGTGKYQGIKGTAPYTLTIIKPPGPSLFAFTADHKVSWEITK